MPSSTSNTPARIDGPSRPWRAAAAWWSLLLAVLLLILAFVDSPERTLFWDAIFDTGHTPLFGLAALAILGLLRLRQAPEVGPRLWWMAFGLTVMVGALTEVLQVFQSNRDPSLEDFLRDVAGAGAFLMIAAASRAPARGGPMPRRSSRAIAALLAVLLLITSVTHLVTTEAVYVERRRAFPVLFALDGSWWERRLIGLHDSALTPRATSTRPEGVFGEPLARLDLRPGIYPGVTFDEPSPDWTGFRTLVFTVVSDAGVPLRIVIRVHDAAHDQRYQDRFNRSLLIRPGVNRIVIPLDDIRRAPDRREMDMRRIRGIILFGYRLAEPTHVYLSALRLE